MRSIMDAYMCMCAVRYIEMVGSYDTRNRKDGLEIFCNFKVLTLPMKQYSVM